MHTNVFVHMHTSACMHVANATAHVHMCMHKCTYAYYAHVYTCTHINAYMNMDTLMHVYMSTCTNMYTQNNAYMHMGTLMHMHTCTNTCVLMYTH